MDAGSKNSIFAFDQFKLDVDKLMLYRGSEEVLIAAKIVKTLAVLVEHAGTIIGKDDLIDRVWEDSIVEESNLTQYLYLLRKVLGTMPDGRPYIETLRRRGYRFNGQVEQVKAPTIEKQAAPSEPESLVSFGAVERDGNVLRVVDWQVAKPEPELVQASTMATPSSTRFWPRLAIGALALVLLGGGSVIFFWPLLMPAASNAEGRREVSVTRLTNGGLPGGATISPDGNYFVYHEYDGEIVRMFVQQTGQSSRMEIASSSENLYASKAFTPDGQFIYFVSRRKADGVPSLFRIPTMGGPSTKILDDVGSGVSFSPDGKEMAFCRLNITTNDTSLVIADKDGRTQRVLLQRHAPKLISTAPAWSPDGKILIFAEQDTYEEMARPRHRVFGVDVSTAQVTSISNEVWDNVLRIAWLPDGKGFVTIATRENDGYSPRRDQVYLTSYPDGVSQRITTDGNRQEPDSLGVTRKGGILSVPGNRSTQIWSMNRDGNSATAVQITKGLADGRAGLGPLPDGRIAYLSRTAEEINILVSGQDGANTKQVASGFPFVEELRADPSGKFLVFSTVQNQKNRLFRVDTAGGEPKQLTFGDGNEIDSTVSPDSSSIVYESLVYENSIGRSYLLKIPSAGGEPVKLRTSGCSVPVYSPDGSLISCVRAEKGEIVVLSASDGSELERYPLPTFGTWNFGIGWTQDGSGLIYIATEKTISNLWIQPRDGTKPHAMTNFSSGIIYRYAFSPDGSRIFVARGYPIQEVVLITDYK